jgi:hypothetical protein
MVPPAWRRTPDPPKADSDTFSVTATKRVGSGTALDCSKTVVAVAVPGAPTIGTVTARRASRERHLHHPESIPTSDLIRHKAQQSLRGGGGTRRLAGTQLVRCSPPHAPTL